MGSDHGHRAVYDASAEDWSLHRRHQFPERRWMERLVAGLPEGAAVLDLGCGAGEPVAAFFSGQGFAVTGLDFSERMLGIARERVPAARFVLGDMRAPELSSRFHAVIAWDSLFHLEAEEQRAVIARVGGLLEPGGQFLFTGGDRAGEVWGAVSGGPVYHASLSPAGYATAFEAAGMILRRYVAEDPETAGRSVWLAQRDS